MKRMYSYISDEKLTKMYDKKTEFPFFRFCLGLLTFKAMYHISILLFVILLVVTILWITSNIITNFSTTQAIKEELEYRKLYGDGEE